MSAAKTISAKAHDLAFLCTLFCSCSRWIFLKFPNGSGLPHWGHCSASGAMGFLHSVQGIPDVMEDLFLKVVLWSHVERPVPSRSLSKMVRPKEVLHPLNAGADQPLPLTKELS